MKQKQLVLTALCAFFLVHVSFAQEIIPLYAGVIPNARKAANELASEPLQGGMYRRSTLPTLEVYLPEKEKATGVGVVICPGGGYSVIVFQGEGQNTAKALAQSGVAAFVLKYRLPDDSTMLDKKIGPLQDAQQAMKLVRENAAKWGVDPSKVGIMGFSAGGHLASTAATHFKTALIENTNQTNLRPDFQILIYPVVSMKDGLTHADSKRKLLGNTPLPEVSDLFSNELQADQTTPPAYITHAADDNVVDVDNSIFYFEKMRKAKVPVEMHIFPKGGHGFVLRNKEWLNPLLLWINTTNSIVR